MSRESTGKTPIAVLAWRISLYVVTPFYLFILFFFYDNILGSYGLIGKIWWLFFWWLMCNAGAFVIPVFCGIVGMRILFDWVFMHRKEYQWWLQNGGDPFWDMLPAPLNTDPKRVRMAIGTPPDYDNCPYDGSPMGQRFGNQCRQCGRFFDQGLF